MAKSDLVMGVCASLTVVLLISGYQRMTTKKERSSKAGTVTKSSNALNKAPINLHAIPDSLSTMDNAGHLLSPHKNEQF